MTIFNVFNTLHIAHETEVQKHGAEFWNYGWGTSEHRIESKTNKGILVSEVDPTTAAVTHRWASYEDVYGPRVETFDFANGSVSHNVIIGHTVFEAKSHDDAQAMAEKFRQALKQHSSSKHDRSTAPTNGGMQWQLRSSRLKTADGKSSVRSIPITAS